MKRSIYPVLIAASALLLLAYFARPLWNLSTPRSDAMLTKAGIRLLTDEFGPLLESPKAAADSPVEKLGENRYRVRGTTAVRGIDGARVELPFEVDVVIDERRSEYTAAGMSLYVPPDEWANLPREVRDRVSPPPAAPVP